MKKACIFLLTKCAQI